MVASLQKTKFLSSIRSAPEEGLGLQFKGEKGEHFFRSSLEHTLFYSLFSAWVLWCKMHPANDLSQRFDWRMAAMIGITKHLSVEILNLYFY
jgi:hypothetical protein